VPDFAKQPLSLSGLVLTVTPSVPSAGRDAFANLLPVVPTTQRELARTDRASAFLQVYQDADRVPLPASVTARITDTSDRIVLDQVTPLPADRFAGKRGADYRLELPVATGPGSLVTQAGAGSFEPEGEAAPLPALAAGSATRVSLRNVDDELVVEIDGAVALRRPYVTRGIDPDGDPGGRDGGTRVVAGASGGTVELSDVGLWRDIHYLSDGNLNRSARSATYTVPDDEFMVLGDNTQNSWDCRQWVAATLELAGGRKITGNYFSAFGNSADSNPDHAGPDVHFRNVFGQDYVYPRSAERGDYVTTDVHSVPERMLLGKALAVFWPLPPFSPTWRLKWVR
jgi:hypothetical protein